MGDIVSTPNTPDPEPEHRPPLALPQFGVQGRPEQKPSNTKRNLIIGGSAVAVVVVVVTALVVFGVGKDDDPEKIRPELQGTLDMTVVNGDGSKQIIHDGPDGTTTVLVPAPGQVTSTTTSTVESAAFPIGSVRLQPDGMALGGPDDYITVTIDGNEVNLPKIRVPGQTLSNGYLVTSRDVVDAVLANLAALGSVSSGSYDYSLVLDNFTRESTVKYVVQEQFQRSLLSDGRSQILIYDSAQSAGLGGEASIAASDRVNPDNGQNWWRYSSSESGPLFVQGADGSGAWQDPSLMDPESADAVRVRELWFTVEQVSDSGGATRNEVSSLTWSVE